VTITTAKGSFNFQISESDTRTAKHGTHLGADVGHQTERATSGFERNEGMSEAGGTTFRKEMRLVEGGRRATGWPVNAAKES